MPSPQGHPQQVAFAARPMAFGTMKIGIVSDIHADAEALAQVFEEMPDADEILCAGDAVSEYEFCADTVALLAGRGVHCIQGNHEAVLFSGRNPRYLEKCRQTYPPESLSFLADAPTTREFDFAGVKVLMTHTGLGEDEYIRPGSPRLRASPPCPTTWFASATPTCRSCIKPATSRSSTRARARSRDHRSAPAPMQPSTPRPSKA